MNPQNESLGKSLRTNLPVIGFAHGSGRTTTVKELGIHLGQHSAICVVDADLVSPSLTLELVGRVPQDLLELSRQMQQPNANTNAATRHVDAGSLRLIPGLTNPRRWSDVSVGSLVELVEEVSHGCTSTVYDLGAGVEPISAMKQLSDAPLKLRDPRQLASVLIESSGVAVVTTKPDDISLSRLVDGLTMRQKQFSEIQLHVVVTQVVNSREVKSCSATLRKLLGINDATFIPHDLDLVRDSLRSGQPASQLKPQSQMSRGYAELAEKLVSEKQNTLATSRMTSVLRRVS